MSHLVCEQLRYSDEVRPFKEIGLPDRPELRDAELKLAHQLVDQISSETFDLDWANLVIPTPVTGLGHWWVESLGSMK